MSAGEPTPRAARGAQLARAVLAIRAGERNGGGAVWILTAAIFALPAALLIGPLG